jgi:hypothetical protein
MSLEELKNKEFPCPYDLSPEEIEQLRQAKKDIVDKVKEMMENDPNLFLSDKDITPYVDNITNVIFKIKRND